MISPRNIHTPPMFHREDDEDEFDHSSPRSEDDNNLQPCGIPRCLVDDKSSLVGPGLELSLSDGESTQCDVTMSFDCNDSGLPALHGFPLNYIQRTASTLSQYPPTAGFATSQLYPHASPMFSPQHFAVPVMTFPQYNSQLPFPDKSGKLHQLSFGGSTSSTYQTPPPSPFNVATGGFPSVYVSPAGLVTVLLKHDIAVEMTVERNIRVVNHRHKAVASTNNRGNTNCVFHVAGKVYQDDTKTEVEVFGERRARMQPDGILFSSGMEVYLLDEDHIVPSQFCFNDMSKDVSMNILLNSSSNHFSNEVLAKCEEITKTSKYYYHKNGSATIIINNIRIHQDQFGEVQVISGPKFISTSPIYGNIYLQTHFVDISVQVNWNVSVKRGCGSQLNATYTNFVVSNGSHEAGFNQYREVFSRVYNPTASEFENWLPALTFLCQGVPPALSRNVRHAPPGRSFKERNRAAGDQFSENSS